MGEYESKPDAKAWMGIFQACLKDETSTHNGPGAYWYGETGERCSAKVCPKIRHPEPAKKAPGVHK